MSAGYLFNAVLDLVSSVPLDPTSTVCAIALIVVAAMTWRHLLTRDERTLPARAAVRARRPLPRRAPPRPPPTPRSPGRPS